MTIDFLVLEQRQRGLAARDRQDAVVAPEDRGNRVAHPQVVVADQDGLAWPPSDGGDCIKGWS